MATRTLVVPAIRVRHAAWDGLLVVCAMAQTLALIRWPSAWLMGVGLWWNANTVSHHFIHRPFFRSPRANRLFALYLTLALGLPQTFWRERHLRHHGADVRPVKMSAAIALEIGCIL